MGTTTTRERSDGAQRPARSLKRLMEEALSGVEDGPVEQVDLPEMAGVRAVRAPHRARPKGLPAPPVVAEGTPLVVLLLGPSACKTTTAAAVLALAEEAGHLDDCLVLGLDPGVVGIAGRLPAGVLNQPETRDAGDGARLLAAAFREVERHPPPLTLIDAGAGNTSLELALAKDRGLFGRLEARGAAVVALWCWKPRTLDLALLRGFEALGQRPTAVGMVLSGHYAQSGWEDYRTLQGQALYIEQLRRGAAELYVPALDHGVMRKIEDRGLSFAAARAGTAPEWRPEAAPLLGDDLEAAQAWWGELMGEVKSAGMETWLRHRPKASGA
jgi:hypothetical protein